MAGPSLFTLIDDIATLLDDISLMTKVAAQKTAGVLADDLALNAQQVTGVSSDRELPVVWAVAKGSLRNKAILVPSATVNDPALDLVAFEQNKITGFLAGSLLVAIGHLVNRFKPQRTV
jgi:predicted DNA repair protein MutK